MTQKHLLRLALLLILLTALLPSGRVGLAAGPVTAELIAVGDARIQGGSPDAGFGSGFIWTGTANGHLAYVQFDLLELPPDAVITGAELRLSFTGTYTGTANVNVGVNTGPWDEATITWNTKPTNAFASNIQAVEDTPGDIVWPVTPVVSQWHSGAQPNYGFVLKGDGRLKAFHSRETSAGAPPRLVVTYTVPNHEGARPDLGDAPDSTNTAGVSPNTAYTGVPGSFPTVWGGTPAGQPAGPRHNNVTLEGVLGQALSREAQADTGPDADTRNNIVNGGNDNADNDRGDDGWRNRTATFANCQPTTLRVRVSKAAGAQLNRMFLNVWFDGNRSGGWGDRALCTPADSALQIPAYEWIVQDYFVDMTGIPAGGFVDIDVPTLAVLNNTPNQTHWMRFTLSEQRAVRGPSGQADGRGPHPSTGAFAFGETEDVLQRPQPPGAPGTLTIQKQVITDGEPVEWIDYVTYQIHLRHQGGDEPLQARLRDVLPYPLIVYPTIDGGSIEYVAAESPTGGVAPLSASLEVIPPSGTNPPQQAITWQGSLAPNSELRLTFQVRVIALCEPNQQTMTFLNRAVAQPRGGASISAEDSFTAKCIDYDEEQISFTPNAIDDPTTIEDLNTAPWSAEVWNKHNVPVRIGLYQTGATQIAQDNTVDQVIELEPNERRDVRFDLPVAQGGPSDQIGDPEPIAVSFCFLMPESDACPDAEDYPNYHGEAPPALPRDRGADLGDAPDSTNHPAAAMTAYPGVPASFPTVFDPATGAAQGPRHNTSRPLHLGERVSREIEADIGPDQDPLNNIVPAADDPDNDRADDGARLTNLAHCQPATAEVRVFISPQAVAWFQQQGGPAYLNTWVDGNRDGDWADSTGCGGPDGGGPPAIEHILIDQPINVVALGAGLHTLTFNTGRVPWPAAQANKPAWVRFTLSDGVSNKTLSVGAIQYGDGRGHAQPFRTGETEDYLLGGQGEADLGVNLRGRIAAGAGANQRIGFTIDYANFGGAPVRDGRLTFTKPAQLRDLEIILLRAPGIPAADVVETAQEVRIRLPELAPGAEGAILLAWEAPAGQQPAGEYAAEVVGAATGDAEAGNNRSSASLARPQAPLRLAIQAGDGDSWSLGETTCSNQVIFPIQAQADVLYDLLRDGEVANSFVPSAASRFHSVSGLPDGRHELWFAPTVATDPPQRSNSVRLNVDSSLPVDPLTLIFTDSAGNDYHPSTLNWGRVGAQIRANLVPGETYTMEIASCLDDPNQQIELALPSGDVLTLTDPDGNGRYSVDLIFDESGSIDASSFQLTLDGQPADSLLVGQQVSGEPAALAADASLQLVVRSGGAERRFDLAAEPVAQGVVRGGGQPLAGVTVTPLAAGPGGGVLPAEATGGEASQTTGADGAFGFTTMGGLFRLLATRSGYQPYRSWDIDTGGGVLAQAITLTPEISGTPAQTIYITANGFVPAVVDLAPGSLVEWVNLDQAERGVRGAGLDSGVLAPGERFRARVGTSSVTVSDPADPQTVGLLRIDGGVTIYLPLIRR